MASRTSMSRSTSKRRRITTTASYRPRITRQITPMSESQKLCAIGAISVSLPRFRGRKQLPILVLSRYLSRYQFPTLDLPETVPQARLQASALRPLTE